MRLAGAILLTGLLGWCADVRSEPAATAVVELFTSEGCSSCPRADVLLGELTKQSWDGGEVIGLSFHVDYWDRLGWKDRFSDNAFTKRQYQYAEKLPDSRVYTPQMVVDGHVGFVGSNRATAERTIVSALEKADEVEVSISVQNLSSKSVKLAYEVGPPRDGLGLTVALAQRGVTTDVKRGENRGRELQHSYVVRAYKDFAIGSHTSGSTRLRIPDDVSIDELDVVAYVQDRDSLVILGATRKSLKGDS
jgi:hypothetical protein